MKRLPIETNDYRFNPLNAELNPTRHLLALVGARHIVHVSRVRGNLIHFLLFDRDWVVLWAPPFFWLIPANMAAHFSDLIPGNIEIIPKIGHDIFNECSQHILYQSTFYPITYSCKLHFTCQSTIKNICHVDDKTQADV